MARGILRKPARPFSLRPAQVIVVGFAAAILIGTALLSLGPATEAAGSAPFTTAAFTSVSAVTVTGLASVDTATYWSPFGQAVILGLVQLGGLGIVTSASILILVVSRRVGLRGRLTAQAEIRSAGGDLRSLRRLTAFIVGFTLTTGGALVANLNLLGVLFRGRPAAEVTRPATRGILVGLTISVLTGVLLFGPRATVASANWIFQLKMALLATAVAFHLTIHQRVARNDAAAGARRATGAVGLLLWIGLAHAGCAFILLE